MPYRKKTTFAPKKKVTRKPAPKGKVYTKKPASTYKSYRGGIARMSVRADPFPAIKYCRMVYSDKFTLTSGAAGVLGSQQAFRLNSIYDPWTGVGSHAPYGHDEMALLYKQYKVSGVLVDILFNDPVEDGMAVSIRLQPPYVSASLVGQDPVLAAQSPMTITKVVNNSGKQVVRHKQYIPMHVAMSVTPLQYKAQVGHPYSAVMGTSPADIPHLLIAAGSIRGSTTSPTIVAQVRLTYYTMFYERLRLSESTY